MMPLSSAVLHAVLRDEDLITTSVPSYQHQGCCYCVLWRFECARRRRRLVGPRCCGPLHWPLRGEGAVRRPCRRWVYQRRSLAELMLLLPLYA
jgi:hypothetical protein